MNDLGSPVCRAQLTPKVFLVGLLTSRIWVRFSLDRLSALNQGGKLLSKYGTEQVGISAEVALADLSGVKVDHLYRDRGRPDLIMHIRPTLASIISEFPTPIEHVAEDQNPIDFLLEGGESLSVKTNMREAGKVAPQNIGQPTSATFWARLPQLIPEGVDIGSLSYPESAKIFKHVAQTRTTDLLKEYWKNLFDCDYLLYVFDVLDRDDNLTDRPRAKVFKKSQSPEWKTSKFAFTQALSDWNESCTVKYESVSIGEFQIHNNRNCFKFRFNLGGLIQVGLL
jgi:hypothetical protein